MSRVRSWCDHHPSARAIHTSVFADFMSAFVLSSRCPNNVPREAHSTTSAPTHAQPCSSFASLPSFNPHVHTHSSHSTSPTPVVPLIAHRVSLPDNLNIVPLASVLPPDLVSLYAGESGSSLLRPIDQVQLLDQTSPLHAPRIAGSRSEYVRLIRRLVMERMIEFTATPKCVNGVFCVAKDSASDRLIIDAQPANRLFVDPPSVCLPEPSHLVQMQIPPLTPMFVGKSDLSNFYHHCGLPKWLRQYFALPPLTPAELAELGLPADAQFPMCVTLPMGWSHAVYLAQSAHLFMLYSSGALQPEDSILMLQHPELTRKRALHGVIVDDFFLFSLSQTLTQQIFDRVLAAYRRFGFVVKASKVVSPTTAPVNVIGFDIHGATGEISLPVDSLLSLVQATMQTMHAAFVTGTQLSHIIGRWTWVMLLRRPSLSVLQHSYRYAEVARGRRFVLWPSVRRELLTLIGLLPLLCARLDTPFFRTAIATDASEIAAGVVRASLSTVLHRSLWPLCSTRRLAVLQTYLQSDSFVAASSASSPSAVQFAAAAEPLISRCDTYYSAVASARWSTLVSSRWRGVEHINALELRAVLLAVHWLLSSPSSLHRRVYLLVDSTVALFTLWKGRSSSPNLLFVLRKINALLLAGSVSLLTGWLPSELNPADAPSRLMVDPPELEGPPAE